MIKILWINYSYSKLWN